MRGSRREFERFVAELSDLGFEAGLATRDGGDVITSGNCPILAVASAHREVACRGLHGELIRLGTGRPTSGESAGLWMARPFAPTSSRSRRSGGHRDAGAG